MYLTKLLFIVVLPLTLLACAPRDAESEAETEIAKTNLAKPASTPITTPDQLIRELYRQHDAGNGPFFQDNDHSLVNRFFEKELADLIWADVTESDAGDSMLDADPLYNAQDTDIEHFTVHAPAERDGATEVRVTFENFGKKQELRYRMVRMRGKWCISDILYPDGSQLFQLLSGQADEMP